MTANEKPPRRRPEQERLALFLESRIPGRPAIAAIEKFGSGQSNPTYLIKSSKGLFVLRAKPPGRLLKSAHLVEREFRVMRALRDTIVPVPRMHLLVEDDESPIGRAFFVMEHVDGEVFYDPALPQASKEARAAIYESMCGVLADLHSVDFQDIGLDDFGRPGNYFERQTIRWTKQYRASKFRDLPQMDKLIDWLGANIPPEDGQSSLVHGDFRLDNMIFDVERRSVAALIDWELSTLGHPMADLAYQCMQWRLSKSSSLRGLGGVDRASLGIPSEKEYVSMYCARRSIDNPKSWTFFLAFAFFRFAAILEGVARRALDGNASNPDTARAYGEMVPALTDLAIELIDGETT